MINCSTEENSESDSKEDDEGEDSGELSEGENEESELVLDTTVAREGEEDGTLIVTIPTGFQWMCVRIGTGGAFRFPSSESLLSMGYG